MSKNFYKIKNGLNLNPQASAPVSPDEGDLYFNTVDGLQVYQTGAWISPGGGSGSGELNMIENPNDANQNWFLSAGTGDLTFATTVLAAELPLEGIIDTAIKFSSSVAGTKYVYTRFKVPVTLLTAKEKLEWYQKTLSGFVADDWSVELWWNDNAAYSGTYTEFPLKNDIAGVSNIPDLDDRYYTQWTGITAAQYLEVRISRYAGAGLAELAVTNVIAGPGVYYVDMADMSPAMAGTIVPYSGPTTSFDSIGSDGTTLLIKNGWALCNGASIDQVLYSQLFTNLATTWNTAARQDGTGGNYSAPNAGFFRIPDLRGVFLRGVGISSRADGSGDVVKTLGQFNNDATAPNGTTAASTVTVNNTDLSHTHNAGTFATTIGLSGSSAALTGTTTFSSSTHKHLGTTGVSDQKYLARPNGSIVVATPNSPFGSTNTFGAPGSLDVSYTGNADATAAVGITGGSYSLTGSNTVGGTSAAASVTMNHAHSNSAVTTLSSTDLETAPRNTGVNYLVKLYDAKSVNIFNSQAASPFKAGFVVAAAQSTPPQGWLYCAGQAVSRNTYYELFTAIGTTYGVGDGSTTFNLPDLRGRVVAGKDDMGGSAASILTVGVSGVAGATLGATGGNQILQSHTHSATGLTVSGTNGTSAVTGTTNISHAHGSSSVSGTVGGSDGTHTHTNSPALNTSGVPYGVDTTAITDTASGGGGSPVVASTGSGHGHGHSLTAAGQTLATTNVSLASGVAAAQVWSGSIAGSTASAGTGNSQNVQPTLILNYFIKAFNDTIDVTGFNEASPTATGFMTNTAQTIGGVKNFVDGIITPSISTGTPNTLTGAGTVSSAGNWIMNSASPFSAAVLTAVGNDGMQIVIKNINTGIVTVDPDGSETIDGLGTVNLNQYDSITILAYSGNWYLI